MEYMSTEIRSAREAMTIFKILGIKDITTERQRFNGTQVFELPMRKLYSNGYSAAIRFATYRAGYVRNVTECNASPYQINKTRKVSTRTSGYAYDRIERILIHSWEDRLIYLAKFIIKNYYNGNLYIVDNYNVDLMKEQRKEINELRKIKDTGSEVSIIVDGHRYRVC